MDEPFSALDPLIRTKLQDELLDLEHEMKRTIIFVSHDLDEAFKLGNRIAIMEGGRIVQCGTPRDIYSAPVSEYVAEFVAHMNPLGVLTARDVMQPTDAVNGPVVDAECAVAEVMQHLTGMSEGLTVVENGRPVGQITAQSVINRLRP
jgi:glycine betaine/proline transport system ATP-binding protein